MLRMKHFYVAKNIIDPIESNCFHLCGLFESLQISDLKAFIFYIQLGCLYLAYAVYI